MEQTVENGVILLSEGKPAYAEHECKGYEAAKALDGRDDTSWRGAPYFKWWKLDLENVCQLQKIRIVTQPGAIVHYFIEASEDQLNWITLIDKQDDCPSSMEGETYSVSRHARWLRVTITYNSSGETAVIHHFEVYGIPLAEGERDSIRNTARISPRKFAAIDVDEAHGFEKDTTNEIEPGEQTFEVMRSGQAGSYLVFRHVDFGKDGVDQLRGQFGFPLADKSKRMVMEVRIDRLDGEKVGEIELFRQWKTWSVLAGDLFHENLNFLQGVHDVYLILVNVEEPQELMIHWLAFVKKTPLPKPTSLPPKPLPQPESNFDYKIFFGNLHSHTGFSDGIGVPEYAYDYARYEAGLDFLAITEHSNLFDNDLDWDQSRKWREIQRIAEEKMEDGKFLALFGAETTWYNQFGHMNTYNMECFINTYETRYNDIPTYYNTVKQYKDSIQQWNHPWSCGNRHHDDFEPYDPELDEVLHTIEINNIECKEMGSLYYYVKALDKGWHVAPVGSQDNHHGQWGTMNQLRTGVLVAELTREHFFDALRHQRVYFTSALHLKCWFQINGSIMGSRIPRTEQLAFDVKALYGRETERKMVRLEVIGKQGRVLHRIDLGAEEGGCMHRNFMLPSGEPYYFIKIYQDDGEFLATAPIWIE